MAGPPDEASSPRPSSFVGSDSKPAACLREGLVSVQAPKEEAVFFNPAQVFNRDLSLLVLKAFATRQQQILQQRSAATAARCKAEGRAEPQALEFAGFNVLEPLAATGLRSLRYLKELPGIVSQAVVNDWDPEAAQQAKANAALNEVKETQFHVKNGKKTQSFQMAALREASTWKKINSLPVGSTIPATFDLSCPPEDLCLLPPLFNISPPSQEDKAAQAAAGSAAAAAAGSTAAAAGSTAAAAGGKGVPWWYDIIDVDPYGSCSPFLDSAVSVVRSGGLLCLTSTDMCTLVGNALETAFYKYGGAATKNSAHHEIALRLVLHAVAQAAARQRRVVQPLLCLSVDFYVRLFVRVTESADQCKQLQQKTAMLFHCPSCEAFVLVPLGWHAIKAPKSKAIPTPRVEAQQPQQQQQQQQQGSPEAASQAAADGAAEDASGNSAAAGGRMKYKAGCIPAGVGPQCAECGASTVLIGGPLYSGPYYDPAFVDLCLSELAKAKETLPGLTMQQRILGMLTALREELPDVALHYQLPSLCTRHKLSMIKPAAFKAALRRLGFRASHFHRDPQAVKTEAPARVVFDVLRAHAKQHPPANPEKSALLNRPIETVGIDFSPYDPSKAGGPPKPQVARWLPNPAPHWGPKGRAGKRRAAGGERGSLPDSKKPAASPPPAGPPSESPAAACASNPLLP